MSMLKGTTSSQLQFFSESEWMSRIQFVLLLILVASLLKLASENFSNISAD